MQEHQQTTDVEFQVMPGLQARRASGGFFLLKHVVSVVLLWVSLGPLWMMADDWEAPGVAEVFSSQSNYLARIEPAGTPPQWRTPLLTVILRYLARFNPAWAPSQQTPPRLTVLRRNNTLQLPHWNCTLDNQAAPVGVLITDDGEYVVTLDNWGSVGYGDNVVAFYGRQGLIRKYSLEQVQADYINNNEHQAYFNLFSHSVSSRWWRSHSIMQFDGTTTKAVFGIWLDWAGRWFAWRLADGVPVVLHGEDLLRWNQMGRAQAHAWLAQPEITGRPSREEMRKWTPAAMAWSGQVGDRLHHQVVACRYLAYIKNAADRPWLEEALRSSELNANWDPELRVNADRALAILDGARDAFGSLSERENPRHYRLGTIDLTIELPQTPAKDEGQLYVSVYPETVKAADWRTERALFRTGTSFKSSSTKAASEVKLSIPAFWPGRYWIKAVWQRGPPFHHDLFLYEGMREWKESREPAPTAGVDDFESEMPDIFELKCGETVAVKIQCLQRGH